MQKKLWVTGPFQKRDLHLYAEHPILFKIYIDASGYGNKHYGFSKVDSKTGEIIPQIN